MELAQAMRSQCSFTYIFSFQSITSTGSKPIACDISKDTYLLDLIDAKERITKNKAIMPLIILVVWVILSQYISLQKFSLRV